MKVSTRARYGLRGLFDIAYHNLGRPTHVKDIARRQGVTPRYLEQIFQILKKVGIVSAQRGPRGGYFLARPPEDITVGDVVRATEGPIKFTGNDGEAPPPTAKTAVDVWDDLAADIERLCDAISLADLCKRSEAEGLPREVDSRRLVYSI